MLQWWADYLDANREKGFRLILRNVVELFGYSFSWDNESFWIGPRSCDKFCPHDRPIQKPPD
jgi:hypothetical protein